MKALFRKILCHTNNCLNKQNLSAKILYIDSVDRKIVILYIQQYEKEMVL